MRVACTIVRTDTGPSESFKLNVGLHQRSVLSPLMFAVFIWKLMLSPVGKEVIYSPICCMRSN